jgi:hypothetical protein
VLAHGISSGFLKHTKQTYGSNTQINNYLIDDQIK